MTHNKKIMIVDDDHIVRENIRRILEPAGFAVLTAENSFIALEIIKNEKPDLALIDMILPSPGGKLTFYPGLSLIEEIRMDFPSLPIIVLSYVSDYPIIVEAIKLGANDYIQKGEVSQEEIQKRVHLYLGLPWSSKHLDTSEWNKERTSELLKRARDHIGLLDERYHYLRKSLALETVPAEKFRLEKEIEEMEETLKKQEAEIKRLESTLSKLSN